MKIEVVTFVLFTLVLACCLEGLLAVSQRCKACKRKHGVPRGRDCPFVEPAEAPGAAEADFFPTCRTCSHRHPSPRGRRCEVLAFDEELPDPLRDNPADHQEQDSLSGLSNPRVLLERLSQQLT